AATQYNSIPGDPTHDVQASPDAQTQMFRTDDPRLQPNPNQAPGDGQWQGAPGQHSQAPQSDYNAAGYAQHGGPAQSADQGFNGAQPWQGQAPRPAHGSGEFAMPEGAQPWQAQ